MDAQPQRRTVLPANTWRHGTRHLAAAGAVAALGLIAIGLTPPRYAASADWPSPGHSAPLSLSLSANTADKAATLLEQTVTLLHDITTLPARQRHTYANTQATHQHQQALEGIGQLQHQLDALASDERNHLPAPTDQRSQAQRQIAQLRAAITPLRTELQRLEREGPATRLNTQALLPAAQRALRAEREGLLRHYTETHPTIQAVDAQLMRDTGHASATVSMDTALLREALQGELRRLERRMAHIQTGLDAEKAARTKSTEVQQARLALQADLEKAQARLDELTAQQNRLAAWQSDLNTTPRPSITTHERDQNRQRFLFMMVIAALLLVLFPLLEALMKRARITARHIA